MLDSLTANQKVTRLTDGVTDAELVNMFLDLFEKESEDVIKTFNVSESEGLLWSIQFLKSSDHVSTK